MTNKISVLSGLLLVTAVTVFGQDKFFTKNGRVHFVSKGKIETIRASHKSVTCVLDTQTGNIQFAVLMKGFEFRKALMQEHFNENYVESDKYPQSEFKGQITNNNAIDYTKNGEFIAQVKGKLTIHGVTRDVEVAGKIIVQNGKLQARSDFAILLSDYNISIPSMVKDNISNNVTITVDCMLEPLKS